MPAGTRHDASAGARLRRTIAESVSEVTGMPVGDVPADVTLTALGATSLEIGRVCARLGTVLERPVPLSQMYRTPTVESLAAWLEATAPAADADAAPAAPALHAPDAQAPLSATQAFMFMKHVFNPGDLSLHCVRSWRIAGRPDRAALRAAVAHVHGKHRYLSAEYQFKDVPYAKPVDVPAPPLAEFLVETEKDARAVLARELARPFNLVTGQVWRAVFVAVRQEHLTLFGFAVHHVAFDGGSAGLMAGDLARAYNAFKAGAEPDPAPAPALAAVAAARDAHLPHVDLDAQRAYWREAVRDVAQADFPGGGEAPRGTPCRMVEAPLPDGTVAGVRALARRLGVSPFAVYLSAYGQTMAELTGSSGFGVGTPVNRRGNTVMFDTVGCAIDILCLRPETDPQTPVEEAVTGTARAVLDAFAAQDVPVSEVADMKRAPASASRNALFQTMFVLQDNNPGDLPLDGLRSDFFRPDYPGVASEVYTEVWPAADGSARLVIGYQPDRASGDFCRSLAERFTARLTAYLA
ncbi:condensation domain-containing protein [Streptomyces sp. VNUA116]|uniref:condensation domain-containing protein n=1 Tax=Streptomyces sp. VNUA116 TaxID=3062449 RepID=UPI002674E77A|nr:condensation domain-containing protein [Streptomyces sp. VNUA116]WKU48238.1 condensation domain-containing protein [Streptomyces sp. VNUA116]